MGLDPSTHQSGKHVGPSKISKRGNRHMRRISHLITLCAIRSDNIFREYYLRRVAEGINGHHSQADQGYLLYAYTQNAV
jgi:transposase